MISVFLSLLPEQAEAIFAPLCCEKRAKWRSPGQAEPLKGLRVESLFLSLHSIADPIGRWNQRVVSPNAACHRWLRTRGPRTRAGHDPPSSAPTRCFCFQSVFPRKRRVQIDGVFSEQDAMRGARGFDVFSSTSPLKSLPSLFRGRRLAEGCCC